MSSLNSLSNKFFDLFSLDRNQYPYAESDKRCFEDALQQFLNSGSKQDAFSVFFCYCEIFNVFGQGYDNTKKLLELLSDHEYHSGELLIKHRDHYSHSVYVFALGLAIYANDNAFRQNFAAFYGCEDEREAAFQFLKFWGMIALFHDIGYPYQLAHEQFKAYVEEVWGKTPDNMYVSYRNVTPFLTLSDDVKKRIGKTLRTRRVFNDLNDLLAYGLNKREGYDLDTTRKLLLERVVNQPKFMDHGYFSAVTLAKRIFEAPDFEFSEQHLDALTAILLHNNFNKFEVPNRHPIDAHNNPLAYLLILCDELQAWDRLAYGRVSKRDPIAWDVALEVSDNRITATYYFDSCLNKNYTEMNNGSFVEKLYSFVSTPLKLTVSAEEKKKAKKSYLFASDDNFICLYDLAKAVHASYDEHCKELTAERLDEDFAKLPLEFKMSNVEQAKSYSKKLERINCFYSSKELDYPVVKDFERDVVSDFQDNLEFLCREEHVRWVREKLNMGWKFGTNYTTVEERNRKRIHKDIVPYELLSEDAKSKDRLAANNIIQLLNKFDSNIKIYNYRTVRKPKLSIAATGHRYFKDDPAQLKEQVKGILTELSQDNIVSVRTCFAYGADQLVAECAAEIGIPIKAYLPMDLEDYVLDVRADAQKHGVPFTDEDELRMRHLLAQTVVCKTIPDQLQKYANASKYIVEHCDKLIAIWDGKELDLQDKNNRPINRGGTYDCIQMAKKCGLKPDENIIIVNCTR